MGMRVVGRREWVQVVRGHGLVLINMRRHISFGWLQRAHRPESVHPASKRALQRLADTHNHRARWHLQFR